MYLLVLCYHVTFVVILSVVVCGRTVLIDVVMRAIPLATSLGVCVYIQPLSI